MARAPHFFKIILENCLQDGKLKIPKKFVRKHGEALSKSNPAFLKLPTGIVWKVELEICDGDEVWLQNGWQEFAMFCSLKPGHLLVFRYEGNSHFNVLIFDQTATETDYPSNISPHGEEEIEIGSSVEILDNDLPPCPKKRKKLSLPSLRPHKMRRTNPNGKAENTFNLQPLVPHFVPKGTQSEGTKLQKSKMTPNFHSVKQEFKGVEGISTPKCEVFSRTQPLTATEKARALQKANGFKSESPYFVVVMQPSYVHSNKMSLPSSFARRYLDKNHSDVILWVSNGRNWHVTYSFNLSGSELKPSFGGGWKAFAQDNKLEVGDVCAFELIMGVGISFKVVIFRATEEQGHNFPAKGSVKRISTTKQCPKSKYFRRMETVTPIEKARAFERASAFSSENPFFMAVMHRSYIHGGGGHLNIPYNFAGKYISEEDCDVILVTSVGRSWYSKYRVRVKINGRLRAELCQGWKAFARDNNLEAGDVCIFELLKGVEISMKVIIFRVAEDANCHQYSSGKLKLKQVKQEENTNEQVTQRPSSSRAPRALKAANEFVSENPFFLVNIRSACLRNGCLSAPRSFTKKYVKRSGQIVRLQVGDKTWDVKMLHYPQSTSSTLSAGWAAFARENTLQEGDVCIFELIKRDDVVLKISIFRRTPVG